jgi:hypothetical protein
LGVAWYDEQFFIDKADAYLNPLHLGMYTSIGIEEGAITVSHWKPAGGGSL